MANFDTAFDDMILAEGGYVLHTVAGDTGGMTYAGIARNPNPHWPGWAHIDRGDTPPTALVRDFYRVGYWVPILGDAIDSQAVATSLFKFAVNTSTPGKPTVAVKVAQLAARVAPDGAFGPKTLAAVNAMDAELFLARFTLAQIARYAEICSRDKAPINWGRSTARKFQHGWTLRALKGFTL